jgi:hypothetical protein
LRTIAKVLAEGWPDDPQILELLRDRAVNDPDNYAREAARDAIRVDWPDDPETA